MKKLHLLCNAHIDPVWQWDWEEGAAAALATFQSAADLAERFDYIFCHNEVTVYKYAERFAPALFARIRELVKEGKWHIMGGWYLQPDCLLPAGEGIVRQIREGERYFSEKFGVKPTAAVNFDPFGHSRGLVQILQKCGQNGYIFMRPYAMYMPMPQLELPNEYFWWEGYDGSRVKCARVSDYNSELGRAREKVEGDMAVQAERAVGLSPWGVGNHGGGPSAKDLADLAELAAQSDTEIVYSTPERFFAEIEPQAVYKKSLISCMAGCYTSLAGLKQRYRELERQLFFTEKLASHAALSGAYPYPQERLLQAEEDLLNVEFHDMLPGTVIRAGEENAQDYIGHGMRILNDVRADAFFALCGGQPRAEEGTYPVFVFDPKTYAAEQLAECEISISRSDYTDDTASVLEVYDAQGRRVPCQTVKEASNISMDWRKRVVFALEPNPMAVSRYTVRTVRKKKNVYPCGQDILFDNGELRVKIGASSGLIESFCVHGKEYAKGALFAPLLFADTPDPWGMLSPRVGEEPQPFALLNEPDSMFEGMQPLQVIEDGELFLAAEAFFGCGHTRLRIGYRLYKKGTAADIDVSVFPSEANRAVKLRLPVGEGEFAGEQIFGEETLFSDGRECVAHDYLVLRRGGACLQLCTPTTYGSSYSGGNIDVTLLRTATYCAHPIPGQPLLRENIFVPKADQGERDFRFRLQAAEEGQLKRNADLFAERPYALNLFPTAAGRAFAPLSVRTDNDAINVVTVKQAVQTEGFVIRLQNCSALAAATTLSCGEEKTALRFAPFEVKTVLYDGALRESAAMTI